MSHWGAGNENAEHFAVFVKVRVCKGLGYGQNTGHKKVYNFMRTLKYKADGTDHEFHFSNLIFV